MKAAAGQAPNCLSRSRSRFPVQVGAGESAVRESLVAQHTSDLRSRALTSLPKSVPDPGVTRQLGILLVGALHTLIQLYTPVARLTERAEGERSVVSQGAEDEGHWSAAGLAGASFRSRKSRSNAIW